MAKNYYTISEYAELCGVSKQAVYKRLTTSLKDYVEKVDGRKVLRSEALQPLHQRRTTQPLNNIKPNEVEKVDTNKEDIIIFLKDQLEQKDKQIQKLQDSADEKDKYIREQGARLTDLIEQSNLLQQNNQMLLKMLSGTTENKEVVIVPEEQEENNAQEIKEEIKKGFFSKIFG